MIGIRIDISDSIFEILMDVAPQKLSSLTLAGSVRLSEEVLIQRVSDFKKNDDEISGFIFIDKKM
jgi:hypothetical protein